MPKAVVKLFRSPRQAEEVLNELKANGYKEEEIGTLLKRDGGIVAKGALSPAISEGGDLKAALIELLGIPEETASYYQLGLSLGGIVVSVQADESRLEEAQRLLRVAGAKPTPERHPRWSTCPPFDIAGRMSETNPIDAPMTGDFRRY
jgi:hypothetical protein